ncbi:tRNA 2-selenouridine(34) synthase MnmH [Sulfurovum sp.]|uniref:tRNA 2-selenouridine(34) synthase MnmH n=1 Tax=Sulfurovum sp. TaxID=1969726 RepID=UPI0025CF37BD|nr:tRNA 2-selenouridine(34) synthase MnmH [Sulfurovum sp.]
MQELPQSSDFRSIVLNNTPLIDVRAPVEFKKGAFPHAVNLPLMNDEERHIVGIKYKEEGNAEAVKLGHTLVSGEVKEKRVSEWVNFIASNPQAMLYCFRGGQRSQISQEWISQSGREIVRLKGGYKAFRSYLMNEIEKSVKHFKPIVLGGRTGSGKTILLKKLKNTIDLEGLANHRGSSFGRAITSQPTQIDFENSLAYDLIQKSEQDFDHLIFEDEGKCVGRLFLPKTLVEHLSQAPLVILETPTEKRIDITFDEYVSKAHEKYKAVYHANYLKVWTEDMYEAMQRIKRRLGGQRYTIVCHIFDLALKKQKKDGSLEGYKEWIAYLLNEYYDPMYDYQIEKNAAKVLFRGSAEEIERYLGHYR